MKRVLKTVAATLCASILMSSSWTINADSGVEINETNFPDRAFRNYVSLNIDADKDGILSQSEIENTEGIDVSREDSNKDALIFDLSGLEFFTNLIWLNCSNNALSSLDISKNSKLKSLDCTLNYIKSLDISQNSELLSLECQENLIDKLDISSNSYMKDLIKNTDYYISYSINGVPYASWSFFTEPYAQIYISTDTVLYYDGNTFQFPDMGYMPVITPSITVTPTPISLPANYYDEYIDIDSSNFPDAEFREYVKNEFDIDEDNKLSQDERNDVDLIFFFLGNVSDMTGIAYFPNIESLYCQYLHLTSLDTSFNTKLTHISTYGCNELTYINLSKNVNLEILTCTQCSLENLDISNCVNLTELYCDYNWLTTIDLSSCPELERLSVDNNCLCSLDLSNCKKLDYLTCGSNELHNLDVSCCPNLVYLDMEATNVKEFDLSNNINLEHLNFCQNRLIEIDITKLTNLKYLNCTNSFLTNLDLHNNHDLEELYCINTYISDLNLKNNPKLNVLYCYENLMQTLDVSCNPILKEEMANYYYSSMNCLSYLTLGDYLCNTWSINDYYEPTIAIDYIVTIVTDAPIPTAGPIPTVRPTEAPNQSVGSFVDRCYEVALGREADEAGYEYWLKTLNDGEACGAQVGYGFVFSEEYSNKNTSNEEFVTDLYSMYFGRPADAAGFEYWVGLLYSDEYSREDVFAGFANSTEFDNLCAEYGVVTGTYVVNVPLSQQGGVNCFVARLYKVCLSRLPDQAGQSSWVTGLIEGALNGTTCAYGFAFSSEFLSSISSNEEYVACMYRAFFGREPDESGFNAWVKVLNGGGSYEDVFNGFTGSAEFINLCADYGIQA